jgi:hypothetical protein
MEQINIKEELRKVSESTEEFLKNNRDISTSRIYYKKQPNYGTFSNNSIQCYQVLGKAYVE